MSYRNKTYVVFDGDEDMWAYAYMLGWKSQQHMKFNFHDAHDLNTITSAASEPTVKRKLRERFSDTKQVIVLVGAKTKNLFRFVRWEIETAQSLGLPIVVVNLNDKKQIDLTRCPAILRDADAIHVPFKKDVIQYALDNFCSKPSLHAGKGSNWEYPDSVYRSLGL